MFKGKLFLLKYWAILEYMENGSLKDKVIKLDAERGERLEESLVESSEILRYIYDVAQGLEYLHSRNIIHWYVV